MKYFSLSSLSFAKIIRILFLAAFLAGAAATPFRMTAQAAASEGAASAQTSAPASETASAGTEADKPEAAESESEDKNIYRHAALVQSAAKALNLPVETTARIFEIINFAIIFLAIAIPLTRLMPRIIRKRGETVRANIEEARKETESANARLSAIETKLSGLDAEIAEIRAHVEQESLQDEARIKASINEESARIVASAEQEIGLAAAHAVRGLQNYAAELAIEQAAQQLTLTPEADQALIAEFVSGIKGGQN